VVIAAMALQIPAMIEAASVGWGENVSDAPAGFNWTCSVPEKYDVGIDADPTNPSHKCRWHCKDEVVCDTRDSDCGCCGLKGGDAELEECSLLAGTMGPVVQAFCALMGFGSLVLKKRMLDDKKGVDRSWAIWGMDVTKQATSGVAAHLAGMINSHFLNRGTGRVGNECSWYFVAFTFDTTCGVMVGYVLLNILQDAAKQYNWTSLQATGNYMRAPNAMSRAGAHLVSRGWCQAGVDGSVWFKQMLSWCLITLIARAVIGAVLYVLKGTALLQWIATAVADPFNCHPDVLLVLVMLGCPLGMNALQLWVQDQFLRDADGSSSKFERWIQRCRGGESDATAPLLDESESLRLSASQVGRRSGSE